MKYPCLVYLEETKLNALSKSEHNALVRESPTPLRECPPPQRPPRVVSAGLASTFMRLGLIDEYRIFVNPVVLGAGIPMFKGIEDRVALKLLKATTMSSGVVALYYRPA